MSNEDIITPHWRLPFQFTNDGDAFEVEQDSDQEIQQSVYAILSYEPGQLMADPTFGIPEPTFSQHGVDEDVLTSAIVEWDPRAEEIIDIDPGWLTSMVSLVTVRRNLEQ